MAGFAYSLEYCSLMSLIDELQSSVSWRKREWLFVQPVEARKYLLDLGEAERLNNQSDHNVELGKNVVNFR